MARTPIPVVTIPIGGSIADLQAQGVASDTANNHTLQGSGDVELYGFNGSAGPVQVTVVSTPSPTLGRSGDIVATPVATVGKMVAGPFPGGGFNQTTGVDAGKVQVDVDTTDAAMILVGVRRPNAAR